VALIIILVLILKYIYIKIIIKIKNTYFLVDLNHNQIPGMKREVPGKENLTMSTVRVDCFAMEYLYRNKKKN
jgi:hypothetical protein